MGETVPIVAVSQGNNFSLFLSAKGVVSIVKTNQDRGRAEIFDEYLQDIASNLHLEEIKAIATGAVHGIALGKNGRIYTFGINVYGELGDGTYNKQRVPKLIDGIERIEAISAGSFHSLILTTGGQAFSTGLNEYGELGNKRRVRSNTFIPVQGIKEIKSISAGGNYSLALRADGRGFAFGWNGSGEPGDGTLKNQKKPS